MGNYTLDGNDLGEVQSERIVKESFLEPFPIALTDSNETDVFDYGGVVKRITVTLWKKGTLSELQSLMDTLDAINDGDQTTTVKYQSDTVGTGGNPGTIEVKIEKIDYDYRAGITGRLIINLNLIEASDRG